MGGIRAGGHRSQSAGCRRAGRPGTGQAADARAAQPARILRPRRGRAAGRARAQGAKGRAARRLAELGAARRGCRAHGLLRSQADPRSGRPVRGGAALGAGDGEAARRVHHHRGARATHAAHRAPPPAAAPAPRPRPGTAVDSSALIDTPLRQARRLSSLIESLLDAQGVASGGQVELRLSRTDLATIAQASLARVRDGLVRLGCEVELRLDAGVDGDWDAKRMEHVVATLIANACKYGEGKPVQVSARREGEMRVLSVSDEGIGIPEDLQERIFGRFGRAAPSRSYGGFGLSLFVARRLAEAHGGTLTVVSEHGKGATFTLRLPRVAAPSEPIALRA